VTTSEGVTQISAKSIKMNKINEKIIIFSSAVFRLLRGMGNSIEIVVGLVKNFS
jgi:hypothetical protein